MIRRIKKNLNLSRDIAARESKSRKEFERISEKQLGGMEFESFLLFLSNNANLVSEMIKLEQSLFLLEGCD